MKKIILTIGITLSLWNITAQNLEYTLDDALENVNQSTVTSGIIYERTLQVANLYNFNREQGFDTANYEYFSQALLEMHRASNEELFIPIKTLRYQLENESDNIVPLGILNTNFQLLNHHVDDEQSGGLLYNPNTKKFTQINNQPPFYTLNTTVISPLKKSFSGSSITYKVDPDYLFQNKQKKIKALTAYFDNGQSSVIIKKGSLIKQEIKVNYTSSGTKTINYKVTYDDNSFISTKSTIYFLYKPAFLPKDSSLSCTELSGYKEDGELQAEIAFQGYEPGDPKIKSKIEYRTFYSTLDAGNNKLDNPIIILDGFDPGDVRKIEDCDCRQDEDCAEKYLENGQYNPELHNSIYDFQKYNDNGSEENALEVLRDAGYDVIVVNHPTYETEDINTNQTVEIDGGAYYIESNAMALIKLLQQTKEILLDNGSNAQIKLVGPSMGGQISRYALSYMEAMEEQTQDSTTWDHNVSHWISIDSPHLGANIPLGVQSLIYLSTIILNGESDDEADRFYFEELSSPASQQQLIEFHRKSPNNSYHHVDQNKLNAHTIDQGFMTDRGNSMFVNHYNNQTSSGIPNSLGFPTKSTNLAIINGSLSGSKATDYVNKDGINRSYAADGEKVLGIEAFIRVNVSFNIGFTTVSTTFRTHAGTLDAHYMPSTGQNNRIAKFYKLPSEKTVVATNNNPRGVLDNVPGGWFPAQDEFAKGALASWPDIIRGVDLPHTSVEYQLRKINEIHSFIPSFSAIAHLNPDQDWNNPLDYNLTCVNNIQTPFDSYFGQHLNTRHTSFSKDSIDWLIGNMQLTNGNVLDPVYPLDDADFLGTQLLCIDETQTFGFEDECKIVGNATFNVSPGLQIISSNGYSAQVKGITNGDQFITVTLSNGTILSKNVYVGVPEDFNIIPAFDHFCVSPYTDTDENTILLSHEYEGFEVNYELEELSNNFNASIFNNEIVLRPQDTQDIGMRIRLVNECGSGPWVYRYFSVENCNGEGGGSGDLGDGEEYEYRITQNPIGDQQILANENSLNIILYDIYGNKVKSQQFNIRASDDRYEIISNVLPNGWYFLRIIYKNKQETHQVFINRK